MIKYKRGIPAARTGLASAQAYTIGAWKADPNATVRVDTTEGMESARPETQRDTVTAIRAELTRSAHGVALANRW